MRAEKETRDVPGEMSWEEAEDTVEMVLTHYHGVRVSKRTHNTTIGDIYGEQHEGVPAAVQIRDAGKLIAVLFWELAVAKGLINPNATTP